MLDLQALKQVLTPLSDLGRGEITIQAAGTDITLRALSTQEMLNCQVYGRSDASDELQVFLNRYQRALLGYAIVEIGGMDLRDETYLTDNGVKVQKNIAIRNLVDGWSETVISFIFKRYGDLTTRLDIEAEKQIKFYPEDLDAEIKRLEGRLEDLRKEKEKASAEAPNLVKMVIAANEQQAAGVQAIQDRPIYRPPAPVVPPQQREKISPTVSVPPTFDDVQDSFGISDEMIAMEEQRVAMARQRVAALNETPGEQDFITPPTGRKPPHIQTGLDAVSAGQIGDVPSFALPAENLSLRGRNVDQGKPVVNPPTQGYNNPRFKKPV